MTMTSRPSVLLTGATGFLGRHLLERLLREDLAIHAVTRTGIGPYRERVTWHRGDLLDPAVPAALIQCVRPAFLLHNAWMAVPGRFWSDPANIDWLHASCRLMAAFAAQGGRHFVGVGTCAEYDWSASTFVEDHTPIRPATLYGKAKAAACAAAAAHAAANDFSAAWGRIFLPYGPGDTRGRLLPNLVDVLLADRFMELGDGALARDFIYAPDAADLLVRLMLSRQSGAFNIATGRSTTLADAIGYVADRLQRRSLLRFNARPAPIEEPPRLVADMVKVEEILDWKAPTSLHAGLDAFLASILEGTERRTTALAPADRTSCPMR